MKLHGLKILVTGADGFIGSHLTEELVRRGYNVRAFVFYNAFNSWGWLEQTEPEIKKNLDIFAGDIRDPYGVKSAMKGCKLVFHLAALISIPYSYHSPDNYVDTNIKGTLNVMQAARELNMHKIVHTSTSEVYGTAKFVPITEEHPLQAQSPYSATKIGADQIAMSFYHAFEMPISIVRPFNTYGPRQSARAVIPTIITQIANRRGNIRLGALHPTRDFSYIKDTIKGFIAVAESNDTVGEVINIGSNFEISIKETLGLILDIMGANVEVDSEDCRLRPLGSEVDRLWADNSKAKRLTGWEPLYGGREGFKRGLIETIEWFTNSENLKCYKADIYNI